MKEKLAEKFRNVKEEAGARLSGAYGVEDFFKNEDGMGTVEVILIIVEKN